MNGLGELEAAVMDLLWRSPDPMRVRDVQDRLTTRRALAYTTVMTVLHNLHRKGWVLRQMEGRAYCYRAARSRDESVALAMRRLLEATSDPEAALRHFAGSASERELNALRRALAKRRPPS